MQLITPLPGSAPTFLGLSLGLLAGNGSVAVLELARPQKLNALGADFWGAFPQVMGGLKF